MAAPVVTEKNCIQVFNFGNDFFSKTGCDARFSQTRFVTIAPITPVDKQSTIRFHHPALSGNQCFDLSNTILTCGLRIVKKGTTSKPDDGCTAPVTFVNNILHSIWKSVSVAFNQGVSVAAENSNYNYKSYLINLLSYDASGKEENLATVGWSNDDTNNFDCADNIGFDDRVEWFTENDDADTPVYREEETVFTGRLLHAYASKYCFVILF